MNTPDCSKDLKRFKELFYNEKNQSPISLDSNITKDFRNIIHVGLPEINKDRIRNSAIRLDEGKIFDDDVVDLELTTCPNWDDPERLYYFFNVQHALNKDFIKMMNNSHDCIQYLTDFGHPNMLQLKH